MRKLKVDRTEGNFFICEDKKRKCLLSKKMKCLKKLNVAI